MALGPVFWPVTAALLAYLGAVQLLAAWQESNIGDEPLELAAGYSYLKTGDFRMNPEHPPLAKIVEALPLLALHPSLPLDSASWTRADEAGFGYRFFEQNSRSMDTLLFSARLMPILLTACLGLAIALWTRHVFGPGAALLALTLYAFDPTVAAHGHYVKNDLPVTLFCFLAVIAWCAFLTRPGLRRLALAGVTLGLAVGMSIFSDSSFRRAGVISAGAPIIRSSPCWLSGNRITSRMFGSSASNMTMRSMPGAAPPCGGAP